MTARLGNNKMFMVLALAAVALLAWGAAMAAFGNGSAGPAVPGNIGDFGLKGIVSYEVRDASGNLLMQGVKANTITDDGLQSAYNLITGIQSQNVEWISIRGAGGDPAVGFDGVTKNGNPGAVSFSSGEASGTLSAVFTLDDDGPAGAGEITEIWLARENAETPTQDRRFALQTPPEAGDWNLTNVGDNITFNWTLTFSRAD